MAICNVSVIIPVYNSSKYIAEAIESVLGQTVKPREIILVDDGSQDNSKDIILSYKDKVKYHYQNNGGVASARNTGISLSTGLYIAFLDADDIWCENKLERQLKYLDSNPEYSCVYTDMTEVDDYGNVLQEFKFAGLPWACAEGWIYENLLHCGYAWTQTLLIRREILDSIGCFDENLHASNDRELALRIAHKYQIGFISQSFVMRRRHESNVSNRFLDIGLREDCIVIERGLQLLDHRSETFKNARRHLGELHARLGRYDLGQGNRSRARASFVKGISARYNVINNIMLLMLCLLPGWALRFLNRKRIEFLASTKSFQ